MARPDQEAIETFMSITGSSQAIAAQKLEDHGDVNDALDSHLERDRNLAAISHNFMDTEENLHPQHQRPLSRLSSEGNHSAPSILDSTVPRNIFEALSEPTKQSLIVTQPRVVRETPIDVTDEQTNKILSDTSLGGSAKDEQMNRALVESCLVDRSMRAALQEYLDLYRIISLFIEITAEQERAQRLELGKRTAPNERLQTGCSFFKDEAEDTGEQPLIRNKSRPISLGSTDLTKNANAYNNHQQNRNAIHVEKLDGISSAEHDEALMAEAIKVGGIPEGSICGFPNDFMQKSVSCLRPAPLPPSPSLSAQCLTREQREDEYLKSLQADIEKETRALEEAKAAREEERRRTEESHKKLLQEKELETELAAKKAALPPEPSLDDENAVTLQVKMPDGNYRGRRFLKSDNLQVKRPARNCSLFVLPLGTFTLKPADGFIDSE